MTDHQSTRLSRPIFGWPNVFSPEQAGMAIDDVWPSLYIGVERVEEMKRKIEQCPWAAEALAAWQEEAEIVLAEKPAFVREPGGGRCSMYTADRGHQLLFDPHCRDRMYDPYTKTFVTPDEKARQAWVTLSHERVRRYMSSLGFLYCLTGEERYGVWVWEGLRALTELYRNPPEPGHGQEKGKYSLVYGGLYEAQCMLQTIQAYTLVESAPQATETDREGLRTHVFEKAGEVLSSWMDVMLVHNMSCWSMAALAVMGRRLNRPEWIEKALYSERAGLQILLRTGLPRGEISGKPDGFWFETSPFYGCFYSLVSLIPLYRLGEESGAIDEDLRERFRSFFEGPLALCDPDLNLLSVGDRVGPGRLSLTQMRYVYEYAAGQVDPERYGPVLSLLYERCGAPRTSLAAVAWGPDCLPVPAGSPTKSVLLDASRMATFRKQLDEGTVTLFFLGGGDTHAGQGHHHNDKLSVSLHAFGEIVTSDLGLPSGTALNDWTKLLYSSFMHNTLLVDEMDQGTMKPLAFEADLDGSPAWAHAAVEGNREEARNGLWKVMKDRLGGRLEEGVCDGVVLSRTVSFDPPLFALSDHCQALQPRRFGFSFAAYGTMVVETITADEEAALALPPVPTDGIYSQFTGRQFADPVTQFIADWRLRHDLWLRLVAVSDGPLDATWGTTPANPREETRGTVLLRAPGVERRFGSVLELHKGAPRVWSVRLGDDGSVVAQMYDGSTRSFRGHQSFARQ